MFKHVVLIRLHAPLAAADLAAITRLCKAIAAELPGVASMRFVANESTRSPAWTHAFVACFDDVAAHDNYQQAPLHVQLKRRVDALARETVVLDYHQP